MTRPGDDSADGAADNSRADDSGSSRSPYAAPESPGPQPTHADQSVFAEPWLQPVLHPPDASDPGPAIPQTEVVSEEQSVWDEPALSPALAGDTPPDALTWYRWYQKQAAAATGLQSWMATLGVIAVSGVLAVFGTFAAQSMYAGMLLGVTVIGPTTEEIMKIALPLWLVEKRPWLYRHAGQILLCALASGAAFAAVENLLYLYVYVPNPPAGLVAWRWTVCVLLHSGCSTCAGVGAVLIWLRFQQHHRAPSLADGAPWILAAIVIHGLYNGSVTLLEMTGLEF